MSTAYAESGRTRQKQRTRDQLLAAARELIEDGETPTVERAAEASGISRTTAYRYFSSQAELLVAAFPETAAASLLPSPAPEAADARVGAVAATFIDRVAETESQLRAMLRLSLGDVAHELPLRQGRAIAWFTEALDPLRESLGAEATHQLALALRSVSGIETRVWLQDIAGLDDVAIRELQLWIVDAVVAYAEEHPPPHRKSTSGRRRNST